MSERLLISSGSPYERPYGYSRAVRVDNRVVISGTAPIWPDGSCDPDLARQTMRCLKIITVALLECGAQLRHVVRTRMYITDPSYAEVVGFAHGQVFRAVRPATSMVVVKALLDPRWKVEVEAEALID
jgi:enamine deaminase RidA (YjgF/YER057c/UK114 family)